MAVVCAGDTFNINSDQNILKINSPRDKVTGPYVVVHKDIQYRYAVVALDFETTPGVIEKRLGMRWFWGKAGTPFIRRAAWFILPKDLENGIIMSFNLPLTRDTLLRHFLAGKINGEYLKDNW